jgi:hypothetical protein
MAGRHADLAAAEPLLAADADRIVPPNSTHDAVRSPARTELASGGVKLGATGDWQRPIPGRLRRGSAESAWKGGHATPGGIKQDWYCVITIVKRATRWAPNRSGCQASDSAGPAWERAVVHREGGARHERPTH